MKSESITKLPLPRFAEICGINPLHFMGIQITEIQNSVCDAAWFQYEWQTADRVSREEVARAIAQAEADIEEYLHYRLLPSWEEQERQITIRPRVPEQVFIGHSDLRGYPQAVETRWKHVISGGRRSKTLVAAGAAVAYANSGPGPTTWLNQATVAVAVAAGTLACEIAVYMPGRSGDDRYRIRPVNVSITGAVATITFRRELAVDPDLQELVATGGDFNRPVDGLTAANFVTTVDVYRIFNSGETQVSLIWLPPNSTACSACGGAGCVNCSEASQTGCLIVRDPRMGQVGYVPATWNATTSAFDSAQRALGRQPEALDLYYYAGLRDRSRACPFNDMDPDWERTVAILAAARLGRGFCECGTAKAFADYWQRNAAFAPGDGSSYALDASDLGNPFGTRVGEIYAWKRCSRPGARVAVSA